MSIGALFTDVIVHPIFNLLVAIYALLPGHDFGIALIIFTVLVRLLMWPIVKKQLHQTKQMRKLQPELKRIKKEAAGDRKKEGEMVMELYKERGINPVGSFGTLAVQFIILIGLYAGLRHLVNDPSAIVDNAYGWLRQLPWLQTLSHDMSQFSREFLGVIDLARPAIDKKSGFFYLPAFLLVIGSAAAQYFQSVQLLPKAEDSRTLRDIMKESAQGKQADQAEVSAAVARSTRFFIPAMIFIFTINLPSALSLYWMVGAIVAYFQQARVLNQDEEELEAIADKGNKAIIEGEVIEKKTPKASGAKKKSAAKRKRRKS